MVSMLGGLNAKATTEGFMQDYFKNNPINFSMQKRIRFRIRSRRRKFLDHSLFVEKQNFFQILITFIHVEDLEHVYNYRAPGYRFCPHQM